MVVCVFLVSATRSIEMIERLFPPGKFYRLAFGDPPQLSTKRQGNVEIVSLTGFDFPICCQMRDFFSIADNLHFNMPGVAHQLFYNRMAISPRLTPRSL